MTNAAPLPNDPNRIQSTQGVGGPSRSEKPGEGGAAFRALLENLEARAQDLKQQAGEVTQAEDLAGAVDDAGASLADALSLSDRLLEAYREAITQDDSSRASEARGLDPAG